MVGARVLASIVGQIISMSLAIVPVAHLRTRALYQAINSRQFWSDSQALSADAWEELRLSLQAFNGQPIWFSSGAARGVFSDASLSGYGGWQSVEIGAEVAHGQWSVYEASLSSTRREQLLWCCVLLLRSLQGTELNGLPTTRT